MAVQAQTVKEPVTVKDVTGACPETPITPKIITESKHIILFLMEVILVVPEKLFANVKGISANPDFDLLCFHFI